MKILELSAHTEGRLEKDRLRKIILWLYLVISKGIRISGYPNPEYLPESEITYPSTQKMPEKKIQF